MMLFCASTVSNQFTETCVDQIPSYISTVSITGAVKNETSSAAKFKEASCTIFKKYESIAQSLGSKWLFFLPISHTESYHMFAILSGDTLVTIVNRPAMIIHFSTIRYVSRYSCHYTIHDT